LQPACGTAAISCKSAAQNAGGVQVLRVFETLSDFKMLRSVTALICDGK
jgi:hypothetical protein